MTTGNTNVYPRQYSPHFCASWGHCCARDRHGHEHGHDSLHVHGYGRDHDRRHGHGVYRWEDGTVHEGQSVDNHFEGHGTRTWVDGDTYNGEWSKDQKHGRGSYTYESGDVYEGEWQADMRHGDGKITLCARDRQLLNRVGEVTSGRLSLCAMCETKRVLPQPVGPLRITGIRARQALVNRSTSSPTGR